MARAAVSVRAAGVDDIPVLMQMWDELRQQAGRLERVGPAPTHGEATERLRQICDDPSARTLLAMIGDVPVGMTILAAAPCTPLSDELAVHVHYLYVRQTFRRRGAGQAMLAWAANFAEEVGAEHVTTSAPTQLRDTNRFLARLGFAPVVVRRSVPVVVLFRHLGAAGAGAAPDQILARRRSMRRLRAAVHVGDLAARVSR